jgi:uncharacterized protein YggU (UPF0235/DUF167 family)
VSVKLHSRIEGVERINDVDFVVRVRVQPENGKANERVRELLAAFFKIPKTHVEILSGHKSKKKIVRID